MFASSTLFIGFMTLRTKSDKASNSEIYLEDSQKREKLCVVSIILNISL